MHNAQSSLNQHAWSRQDYWRLSPAAWVVSPSVDLLFLCGGLVFAVVLCIVCAQSWSMSWFAGTFVLATSANLCSETHICASLTRAFASNIPFRHKRRIWAATIGCLCLVPIALVIPGALKLLKTAYLVWVVHHFSAQSYGIVRLYCAKSDYVLSESALDKLRQVFEWAMICAWLHQISAPSCLSMGIAAFDIAILIVLLRECLRNRRSCLPPAPALLVLASTLFILLPGCGYLGALGIYIPTLYHGLQHLSLSLGTGQASGSTTRLSTQIGVLLLCVIAAFCLAPYLVSSLGAGNRAAFAVIFYALSIHHFLLDSMIWRLGDPAVRRSLLPA